MAYDEDVGARRVPPKIQRSDEFLSKFLFNIQSPLKSIILSKKGSALHVMKDGLIVEEFTVDKRLPFSGSVAVSFTPWQDVTAIDLRSA